MGYGPLRPGPVARRLGVASCSGLATLVLRSRLFPGRAPEGAESALEKQLAWIEEELKVIQTEVKE